MPILRLLSVALLALSCSASLLADPVRTEQSTILMMGKPAGQQSAEYADDGKLTVRYEYNDRGRGPKIDASYVLDADGTPQRIEISGVNYLKSPVSEVFQRDEHSTSWKNASENEQQPKALPGFYSSLEGTPEELTLLARAALAAPTHRLPMLPVGEVSIAPVTTLQVEGAKDTKPRKLEVQLYAMTGLGLTPTYLWLDHDQRFFAAWSSWQSTVRTGYEPALEALGKRQEQIEGETALARAKALTHRLDQPLLIDNVRVFDPATLKVSAGQRVLVENGKIKAVGPADQIEVPNDAERWDGAGRFLMPGLWDMHVHVGDRTDGLLRLASGVTTVRDLANDNDALAIRIAEVEAGKEIGPRVLRAGFMDGRGPYAGPTKVLVDTEDEARAAVKMFADQGFVQIKVYSSMKPELIPLVIKLAHERGLRVSGHVPQGMSAQSFVEAGADEVQHANFVLLNFLATPDVDTRTPQRFVKVAKDAAHFDLGGQPMHQLIELFLKHHTVIDPTLVAFEDMFLDQPGRMAPTWYHVHERFPASWQRTLRAATGGLEAATPADEILHRESYRKMIDLVGLLYRSGVTIVAGTDAFPAFSLVRELELYVSAGISPAETLRIATLGAAQVMGRDKEFGRIAPGFVADLILVDGDPTSLVGDLHQVHRVLRGDRWFEPEKLFEAVAIRPASTRTQSSNDQDAND